MRLLEVTSSCRLIVELGTGSVVLREAEDCSWLICREVVVSLESEDNSICSFSVTKAGPVVVDSIISGSGDDFSAIFTGCVDEGSSVELCVVEGVSGVVFNELELLC